MKRAAQAWPGIRRRALGAGLRGAIRFVARGGSYHAAALTYYSIFSFFPAGALVYALLGTLMRISELSMPEVWTPNLLVYAYCIAVSFAMSITFSLLPALRSTRVGLSQAAGATSTTNRLRFNLVLLTAQFALWYWVS